MTVATLRRRALQLREELAEAVVWAEERFPRRDPNAPTIGDLFGVYDPGGPPVLPAEPPGWADAEVVLAWAAACVGLVEGWWRYAKPARPKREELLAKARELCPDRLDEAVAAVDAHIGHVPRVVHERQRWEKPEELAAYEERQRWDAVRIPLGGSPGPRDEAALAAAEALARLAAEPGQGRWVQTPDGGSYWEPISDQDVLDAIRSGRPDPRPEWQRGGVFSNGTNGAGGR